MTSVRVSRCIVGGGPAGLMLGLLLAKRGAEVLVLEGHEDFEREFRGEVLQPSTAHLLDELGLLEYVLAQPHSLLEAAKIRLNGREVGEFSFKRIAPQYPYAIWMPQPVWSSTFYVSLGDVRGLMLPKYPHHIQAGIILPTGEWKRWRDEGVAVVAQRIRRFDPIFTAFADSLRDFTPFFPLEGIIRLLRDWTRDGLLLIGDAAHTMSPVGAIGVNVAVATAAVAAQELYPHLGHGPIKREVLRAVQRLREDDVRTLHRFQLGVQGVLLRHGSRNPVVKWLVQTVIPVFLRSPLLLRVQRRLFFGAPLPPLDPAFSFSSGRAFERESP